MDLIQRSLVRCLSCLRGAQESIKTQRTWMQGVCAALLRRAGHDECCVPFLVLFCHYHSLVVRGMEGFMHKFSSRLSSTDASRPGGGGVPGRVALEQVLSGGTFSKCFFSLLICTVCLSSALHEASGDAVCPTVPCWSSHLYFSDFLAFGPFCGCTSCTTV